MALAPSSVCWLGWDMAGEDELIPNPVTRSALTPSWAQEGTKVRSGHHRAVQRRQKAVEERVRKASLCHTSSCSSSFSNISSRNWLVRINTQLEFVTSHDNKPVLLLKYAFFFFDTNFP